MAQHLLAVRRIAIYLCAPRAYVGRSHKGRMSERSRNLECGPSTADGQDAKHDRGDL